jgi:hypothetical protein
MDISPFEQWKLRYIIHLAIYLNLNSPTDFFDEAKFKCYNKGKYFVSIFILAVVLSQFATETTFAQTPDCSFPKGCSIMVTYNSTILADTYYGPFTLEETWRGVTYWVDVMPIFSIPNGSGEPVSPSSDFGNCDHKWANFGVSPSENVTLLHWDDVFADYTFHTPGEYTITATHNGFDCEGGVCDITFVPGCSDSLYVNLWPQGSPQPTSTPISTSTPIPTPIPTPTPCEEVVVSTTVKYEPLPIPLMKPYEAMGGQLGIEAEGKYSFSETVKNICCNGEHFATTDTSGSISVSLKARYGIPNLSITLTAPPITVGTTTYTATSYFGVYLNGDITLGGNASWAGTCDGYCLSGTIDLAFTAQAEFTFDVKSCKKTLTSEECTCIEIDFISAQLKVFGRVQYKCVDDYDFLDAGIEDIPLVTKVDIGVGVCHVDVNVTWGSIPGIDFIK